MISLPSSSSRAGRAATAVLGLLLAGGCARVSTPAVPESPTRVALLPPENLSGSDVGMREFTARLELALARAGIEVVAGDAVDRFLTLHRIRYTGGISGPIAQAAKEDLGVDALLATWIGQRAEGSVPRIALAARLVSATDPPAITWVDTVALAGDDHPGLFNLGLIGSLEQLERQALDHVTGSLSAFLYGHAPRAVPCGRTRSATWVRATPLPKSAGPLTAIVLPFSNLTGRRGAGELVAMELTRQLLAVPDIQVLEPGTVRDELLRYRVIMQDGPSFDDVLALRAGLGPNLIISGQVQTFLESGEPKLGFSVTALDVVSKRIVWRSSGYAGGDDGVFFFDAGRVSMPTDLACQMASGIAKQLSANRQAARAPSPPAPAALAPGPGTPDEVR
jgi:hypothetical protein